MKVKINNGDHLYCVECKNRIREGEKYAIITEQIYDGTIIEKELHLDCTPIDNDDMDDLIYNLDEEEAEEDE